MGFKSDIWPLITTTAGHCLGALMVGAAFSVAFLGLKWLFPGGFLGWWLDNIEIVLVIVIMTALAVIFISAVFKLVLSAIISMWKGFPHGILDCIQLA
jgi:hypothetical protein